MRIVKTAIATIGILLSTNSKAQGEGLPYYFIDYLDTFYNHNWNVTFEGTVNNSGALDDAVWQFTPVVTTTNRVIATKDFNLENMDSLHIVYDFKAEETASTPTGFDVYFKVYINGNLTSINETITSNGTCVDTVTILGDVNWTNSTEVKLEIEFTGDGNTTLNLINVHVDSLFIEGFGNSGGGSGVEENLAENVKVYSADGTVYINSNEKLCDISVYSLDGKEILRQVPGDSQTHSFILQYSGFYIVSVVTESGQQISKKIYLE